VRLIGTDIDRVETAKRVDFAGHAHLPAASDSDYHMAVAMAFQAREATGFKLEVA
jgi:hypothetical protein